VSKVLESRGVKYSHRNDDILVPNTIEEQRMKKARKVCGHVVFLTSSPHHLLKKIKGKTPTRKESEETRGGHRPRT